MVPPADICLKADSYDAICSNSLSQTTESHCVNAEICSNFSRIQQIVTMSLELCVNYMF